MIAGYGEPYTGTQVETPETAKGEPKVGIQGDAEVAEVVEGRGLAKGNLGGCNRDRTQCRDTLQQALDWVRQAARSARLLLTALWHHVYDIDRLREAYYSVNRRAAPGVDGETWAAYGRDLEANLRDLSGRLERGRYHAQPVQRVYIPKPDGRERPIGIPTLEDKIVQRATVEVLNAVYEGDFLGIITSITVKLLPKPAGTQVLLAAFERVADAGNGVAAVIAAGIIPAGLEMMDALAIRAAEDYAHAGYPLDAAAILLCELDGYPEEIAEQLDRVEGILRAQGAVAVRVAKDEAERRLFWAGRKAAFPAVGRIAPDYYCMDGTIPRRELARVLAEIAALSKKHGLRVANVFHAGDGNLHPLILYDANRPGELQRAEALGSEILELCVAVGGTITGEHGVGIEKLKEMCVQFSAAELSLFHAVKRAFDPDGLLNPGKAIPTLRRCAEIGRMHVHRGALPFPELERF